MNKHFIDSIKDACIANPGKTAILSGCESVTYSELWDYSERLARHIVKKNTAGKPVIVYGKKSPFMIISFLACAKAGCAYCPTEASVPAGRLKDIMDTIEDPLVIATETFPVPANLICNPETIRTIAMSKDSSDGEEGPEASRSRVSGDDTTYIIFTSGSTGKPKGVEISADNLSSFAAWAGGMFPLDRPIINQAALSFDLSVMDVYAALTLGRSLCCMSKELQGDIAAAVEFIRAVGAGYIVSTPSFANMLLSEPAFNAAALPKLAGFRFCGERLTETTASRLLDRFPEASIINTYGPTESTVCVTETPVTREMIESQRGISIGSAKPGTAVTFDNGEIIISGDTVGKGYYKDPERTAAAFFMNENGERSYRTGDLGCEADGLLYFKGRKDSQIKLNGYRIELLDIEANLEAAADVKEAAVLCKRNGDTIRYLVGAVVLTDTGRERLETSGALSVSREIKKSLSERLPSYMIPKRFVYLDAMPLNANSKLDRKRLEALI